MNRRSVSPLVLRARALWELFRYDTVFSLLGFRGVRGGLPKTRVRKPLCEGLEAAVAQAIEWAGAFYWKRVLCLQQSIAVTRLLRAYGIPAEVVIGCQVAPFIGHAWVEVEGRMVSGLLPTPERLQVLDRA